MSVRVICARTSDKVDNGKMSINGGPIEYPSDIEMYVDNICFIGRDYYVRGDDIILPTFETLIDELFPKQNGNFTFPNIDTRTIDLHLFKHVISKSYVPSMCSRLVILKMLNKYCYDGEFNLFVRSKYIYGILEFIVYMYRNHGIIPKITTNNFKYTASVINGKFDYSTTKYRIVKYEDEIIEVTASVDDFLPTYESFQRANSISTFDNGKYNFIPEYVNQFDEIKVITTMKSARNI